MSDEPIDTAGDLVEPYTLTELSNGLEALLARLDQTEDHFGGALDKISKAVLELRAQVAELIKDQPARDIDPRPWIDRATPAQWAELVGWVDWMQARYGALPEFDIQPCWPAHTGMVEELAGLFHSWKRAQIVDELAEKTGSNDLTGWHDRWFWPFRQRAKSGHYRTTNCQDEHKPERVTAKPTDPQHLPGNAQRSNLQQ